MLRDSSQPRRRTADAAAFDLARPDERISAAALEAMIAAWGGFVKQLRGVVGVFVCSVLLAACGGGALNPPAGTQPATSAGARAFAASALDKIRRQHEARSRC